MKKSLRIFYAFVLVLWYGFPDLAQYVSGDTVTHNGRKFKVVSTNLIPNPGFENGFSDWTDATSAAAPLQFTVMTTGGANNSKYLVGTTNEGSSSSGSLGTGWAIQAGKTYYISFQAKARFRWLAGRVGFDDFSLHEVT